MLREVIYLYSVLKDIRQLYLLLTMLVLDNLCIKHNLFYQGRTIDIYLAVIVTFSITDRNCRGKNYLILWNEVLYVGFCLICFSITNASCLIVSTYRVIFIEARQIHDCIRESTTLDCHSQVYFSVWWFVNKCPFLVSSV